jgi:hypothetical protein
MPGVSKPEAPQQRRSNERANRGETRVSSERKNARSASKVTLPTRLTTSSPNCLAVREGTRDERQRDHDATTSRA